MLTVTNNYINQLNTECIQPAKEWCTKHPLLVSAIGVTILLGAACLNSPEACGFMLKNIKFLTVIVPIAYTMTFPIVTVLFVMAGGAPLAESSRHYLSENFGMYCASIPKVWEIWFQFVGIV